MKFSNSILKQHHHVRVDSELKLDCMLWLKFLEQPKSIYRPFVDFNKNTVTAEILDFYTDAAKSDKLGLGCIFGRHWLSQCCNGFIQECDPSIEYLELFALVTAVNLWGHKFSNKRVIIFCDNLSVVQMVNNSAAKCKNCMILIRLLTLNSLKFNFRIFVRHVKGIYNTCTDLLSRNKIDRFFQVTRGKNIDKFPTTVPEKIWPPQKLWLY